MIAWLVACSEYRIEPPVDADEPVVSDGEGPVVTTEPTEAPPVATDPATDDEPVAEAPVYANTSGELYEIDPATGARTLVGAFHDGAAPVTGMVDIAIDLSGRIYGGTFTALYQIDPLTAAVSQVCRTDLEPYALAFTSDGVLFAGAGTDVVEVDLSDCSTTPLFDGAAWETSGDLVGLPDGFLYWTVLDGSADGLVRVDPVTGATFWVGPVGEAKLFGLGYDQDQLYGFSSNGTIVRIDPLTGSTTAVVDDGMGWWGATTNPVVW